MKSKNSKADTAYIASTPLGEAAEKQRERGRPAQARKLAARARPAPPLPSPPPLGGRENINSITLHGVFMQVAGLGVLLTGASGVGKSELALELLARGHQLIADDAADLRRQGKQVIGRCPPLLRGFLEARSLGILNIRKLHGARALKAQAPLDLIIQLDTPQAPSSEGLERLTGHRRLREVLGLTVPEISIPIRLGHNLAVLVEAACADQTLRRQGYRADDDLARRQLDAIRKSLKNKPRRP